MTVNAYVHVLGVFGSDGRCIIDDNHHMIILHPDHLISSTALSDSFDCIRKAVLQDRVKATSSMSAPLIYGTILHEIFQAAMLANQWDTEWLDELINNIATRHIEDLYTIRLEIPQAVEYLRSKMPELQSWAALFVASNPKVSKHDYAIEASLTMASLMRLLELGTVRPQICVSVSCLMSRNMYGLLCMASRAISMQLFR